MPYSPLLMGLSFLLLPTLALAAQEDPRAAYDVEAYRLDLRIDPAAREVAGTVSIELTVTVEELGRVVLDLSSELEVERTLFARGPLVEDGAARGETIYHEHADDRLECHLPHSVEDGGRVTLAVRYRGHPGRVDRAHGVLWERKKHPGPTLLDISLQNAGAHHWFPCKASRFHPEDRPRRVLVEASVPDGLVAAACGRLVGREQRRPGWTTWRWRHDYPIPTYGIGVAVGSFETVGGQLELPGHEEPVPLRYFVLPEDLPAARVQFADLEELLTVYSRAFGPWPFPDSKVGIVQGAWLTTDHSTLIGYGSSFPAWRRRQGLKDPFEHRNRDYDSILAHQLAHEWWGNSVGAVSWRDYWLHEGFATFAESLWLEHRYGRERADDFFAHLSERLRSDLSLLRPQPVEDARRAFGPVLYLKGAWVLHLARHYLDDDERFFGALRRFQGTHRHDLASTEDLRRALERESEGQDLPFEWGRFFDEWVYGTGAPRLTGRVKAHGDRIEVEVDNDVAAGRSFLVPLDLAWIEDGDEVGKRLWLEPGTYREALPAARPERVRVEGLQRLLGRHRVVVEE